MSTHDQTDARLAAGEAPAADTTADTPADSTADRTGDSAPPAEPYTGEGREDAGLVRQRDRFGGVNWGSGLFGSLVAHAVTLVLTAALVVGIALLGFGELLPGEAGAASGTGQLVTSAALLGVLLVAFYSGGYVAGRMSRFDGGRQGVAVWVAALLLVGAAAGLVLLASSRYDVLHLVGLSGIVPPVEETAGPRGAVLAGAALLASLLAAVAGGKVGCGYHRKVDDAAVA